jgi:uncharacterized protein (DUF1501 family)
MTTTTAYIAPPELQEHTLVLIFLRGGADGLNMVAPVEDDAYHRARPTIGISKKAALPLDDMFGLNPALAPLLRMYQEGALTIVHQTGSEDASRSHFEAQDLMEQGGDAASGWLGRYLRLAPRLKGGPLSAIALGKTRPTSLWGAPSSVTMESFDSFNISDASPRLFSALKDIYAKEKNALGVAGGDAITAMSKLNELRTQEYRPENDAHYPACAFGAALRRAAQLVKARMGLEAVTLDLDGWDAHFAESALMNPLMRQLAEGLSAFHGDLGSGMDNVTVVVMTEFGRRVYQNVSFGTDHGRGGVMFVLGSDIRGGQVVHQWKGLDPNHLEDPGDLPVAYNYRDVLAPILTRHGGFETMDGFFPAFPVSALPLYG